VTSVVVAMDHKADELDSRVTARTSGGRSADRSTPFDEVSHIITQYMYINAFDGVMVCISFITRSPSTKRKSLSLPTV
jgi:hypothetical protein